jgi:hypothetical protein
MVRKNNGAVIDFLTGRATKLADVLIENEAMRKDGSTIIGSSGSGDQPPEKVVAEMTIRKEKSNTSNIDNNDPFKTIKDNKLPIAIGSGALIIGLILVVVGKGRR